MIEATGHMVTMRHGIQTLHNNQRRAFCLSTMVRKISHPNTSTFSLWEHLASLQDGGLLANKIHNRPGASEALVLAEPKKEKEARN